MVEESRTELKEIIEKKREEEEEKAYREIGKLAEKRATRASAKPANKQKIVQRFNVAGSRVKAGVKGYVAEQAQKRAYEKEQTRQARTTFRQSYAVSYGQGLGLAYGLEQGRFKARQQQKPQQSFSQRLPKPQAPSANMFQGLTIPPAMIGLQTTGRKGKKTTPRIVFPSDIMGLNLGSKAKKRKGKRR